MSIKAQGRQTIKDGDKRSYAYQMTDLSQSDADQGLLVATKDGITNYDGQTYVLKTSGPAVSYVGVLQSVSEADINSSSVPPVDIYSSGAGSKTCVVARMGTVLVQFDGVVTTTSAITYVVPAADGQATAKTTLADNDVVIGYITAANSSTFRGSDGTDKNFAQVELISPYIYATN